MAPTNTKYPATFTTLGLRLVLAALLMTGGGATVVRADEAADATATRPAAKAPNTWPRIVAQSDDGRRLRRTTANTWFAVEESFDGLLEQRVESIRGSLRTQQGAGKFLAYISTPISPRGGGHTPTNVAIAEHVRDRLHAEYGDRFWALCPAEPHYALPAINDKKPGGGEYMWMWTEVLVGEKGTGDDFDLVYFVGPSDVHRFFGQSASSDKAERPPILESVNSFVEKRSQADTTFRTEIADQPSRRRDFTRFYSMRASALFSLGAHDEWNLYCQINAKRGVGEQIPVYFDGRAVSPAEATTAAPWGYQAAPQAIAVENN